jgi:hypothetical protein
VNRGVGKKRQSPAVFCHGYNHVVPTKTIEVTATDSGYLATPGMDIPNPFARLWATALPHAFKAAFDPKPARSWLSVMSVKNARVTVGFLCQHDRIPMLQQAGPE